MTGDSCEHAGANFVAIMEREYEVGPVRAFQDSMRTTLSFDAPADPAAQRRKDVASLH